MKTLKDATKENHEKAEKMPFNMRMFSGQLTEDQYLLHLVQQLEIFKAIETKGLPSNALSRIEATQKDIDELLAKGNASKTILISTQNYVDYINTLTENDVLPHVYLNYLALMFGGKIMKTKVPSTGKMYDFKHRKEAMLSVRTVQKDEWADEVNRAYGYIIAILDELHKETS
ncbi:biliverdin-producing heme oxygenase [Aquimarina longa]|uniref:biliverdin-producing heme oxygenase n=1 Tax=Aquimarina longa TaxID=1080221 RepID=UPI0007834E3E|nr:biliverdin-producing heme oxygenase [Aquimarina longa]